jgi:hypothetical protein
MSKTKDFFSDHLGSLSTKRIIPIIGYLICGLIYIINIILFSKGILLENVFTKIDNSVFNMFLFLGGLHGSTVLEKIGFKK